VFQELAGELGYHFTLVAEAYAVDIDYRGSTVVISGEPAASQGAAKALEQVYALIMSGHPLAEDDCRQCIQILRSDPDANLIAYFEDTVLVGVRGRRITPRSPGQRHYLHTLRSKSIVFGVGPAGTGKTYLAMAMAVAALKRGDVRRIVLTRPAVEAGEKLGFLPGDLSEKVDPYLRPLYDALKDMMTPEQIAKAIDAQVIEVAPLAFMRGRTLDYAYVVLDEAQNTTIEQMRMFLTRLGSRSRMVVTGDITQVDLPIHRKSGMAHALAVLDSIQRVGVCHLTVKDVIRHPIVAEIIEAYESDDKRRLAARKAQESN
jgi:phosphate starvation-inducible protein PhoH and related proteins